MSVALDIARTLPILAGRTDREITRVMRDSDGARGVLGHYLSSGERAVLTFAQATESMLARVDTDTRDAVLQVVDRAVALGAV